MSFFCDNAIEYASLGLPVFPIAPGLKVPLIKEWQNLATTDERQIMRWAREAPNANVGILTGPRSGVLVVDVDVKDGRDGRKTLIDLEARGKELPDCPVSRTPSGGYHLWLAAVPGLRNCAGRTKSGRGIGEAIDVRADGGYAMAPPSRLRQTEDHGAGQYRWRFRLGKRLPELPQWAVDMLREKPVAKPAFVVRRKSEGGADANLERIAAFVAAAPKGQHNNTIYWAAREALRAGASPSAVRERIEEAGRACGHAVHRIRATLDSAFRAEGIGRGQV